MNILDSLAARLGYAKIVLAPEPKPAPEPEPDYEVAISIRDKDDDFLSPIAGVMTAKDFYRLMDVWVRAVNYGDPSASGFIIAINGIKNYMGINMSNVETLTGVQVEQVTHE